MNKNKTILLSITLISSLSMCGCSLPNKHESSHLPSTNDSSDSKM